MSPRDHLESELQRHGASLRALAWNLVRDRHAAEDLVQEAWSRSLASPPRRGGALGGWLATVVRNLASKHRRGERRRLRREAEAACAERVEGPAEDLARREVLRRVVDELLALQEPYRGTLMLRYFEGLTPRAIAVRTATALPTVKSRLQRGLAILRARLADLRERRAWGPLIPILGGAVAKTTKLSIVAALLVLAGAALIWSLSAQGEKGAAVREVADGTLHTDPLAAGLGRTEEAPPRTEQPLGQHDWTGLDHPYSYELVAVVRDEWGLPVPGASVQIAPLGGERNTVPGRTGPDGTLRARWRGKRPHMDVEIALDKGRYPRRVSVAAGAPRTLRLGEPRASCKSCHAQPSWSLPQQTVRVAWSEGGEGGSYRLQLHGCSRSQERGRLGMREGLHPFARFAEALTAGREEGSLDLSIGVHTVDLVHEDEALQGSVRAIVKHLQVKADTPPAILAGTVYGPDGRPVEGAVVAWGPAPELILCSRIRTDAQGSFRAKIHQEGRLFVRAGGSDQGLREGEVVLVPGQTTRWDPVLELGAVMRGRALAADGSPLHGWRVEYEGTDHTWFDACTVAEDGTFVLPNLPGGAGRLLLWSKHQDRPLPVTVLQSVLPDSGEIVLHAARAGGSLRFRPLAAGEETPLSAFAARAWQEATGRAADLTAVGEQGIFALEHLAAGWYRIELRAPGAGWQEVGRTWVDGDGATDLGSIMPRARGILLVDDEPDPDNPPELYRRLEDLDVRILHELRDGRVPLPAGDYLRLGRDAAGNTDQRAFRIRAGETTVLPARR